jgi:hypothetical protein
VDGLDMTFVIKRDGKEVSRFRAAKITRGGKFAFTMFDASGKLIGSFFLTTEKSLEIEEVTNGVDDRRTD